jgi:hypothetical protein
MMFLRWDGDRPLADRELVAALYEVSTRTVRRHCRPVAHEPRAGRPRGAGGIALYDAFAVGERLAAVTSRPARTTAALHERLRHIQAGL